MTDRASRKQAYHSTHPLLRSRLARPAGVCPAVRLVDADRQRGLRLVGIGGAGKTAVVERLLRQLCPASCPRSWGSASWTPCRGRAAVRLLLLRRAQPGGLLHPPGGLADRPEQPERDDAAVLRADRAPRLLENAGPCLLVLDGLEKVQEDGLRGAAVRPDRRHAGLRGFVLRAAEGWLGEAAVLITTATSPWTTWRRSGPELPRDPRRVHHRGGQRRPAASPRRPGVDAELSRVAARGCHCPDGGPRRRLHRPLRGGRPRGDGRLVAQESPGGGGPARPGRPAAPRREQDGPVRAGGPALSRGVGVRRPRPPCPYWSAFVSFGSAWTPTC